MSLSRPRCWLVASAFRRWGDAGTMPVPRRPVGLASAGLLALVVLSGCGGSLAAPSGTDTTPIGLSDGAAPDKDKSPPAQIELGRRPLEAPAGGGEEGPSAAKSKKPPLEEEDMSEHPFPRRVKAPPLEGGKEWLNSAGPLDIKDLRGKWVLLDFWTYCCINCMHILPELKKLEKAHPNDLVVIGVHSAKFETEKGTKNIREAILRHEIEHPVVNDADHAIWENYGISSWPSLRLIDPEGNLVAQHSGEIDADSLDGFLKKATPYYAKKGVLDPTPLEFKQETHAPNPLRFPGKLLADAEGQRLFIADSSHNRIVVARLDGTLIATIGDGRVGLTDGDFGTARFNKPQGMALRGDMLYVADTENHVLRKVDLAKKQVTTIAGTGRQRRTPLWPGITFEEGRFPKLPERYVGKPKEEALASPWDLWIHGGDLYIAMAGPHQIWKMTLDEKEIGPYAGNGREDIVDGSLLPPIPPVLPEELSPAVLKGPYSSFAQPSGLASDGEWLYVADSEGSSVRAVPLKATGEVRTVVGTANLRFGRLFKFGDVDGALDKALLQHCLAVAYHEGKLYVADTYNDKIKEIDLKNETIKTIAGGKAAAGPSALDEPAGLSVAGGKLYVADTNSHRVRVIDLADSKKISTIEIAGLAPPRRPPLLGNPSSPAPKRSSCPRPWPRPRRASSRSLLHWMCPKAGRSTPTRRWPTTSRRKASEARSTARRSASSSSPRSGPPNSKSPCP